MAQPKSITYEFANSWHVTFRRHLEGWAVVVQHTPRDHWSWEANKKNGTPSQTSANSFLRTAKKWHVTGTRVAKP